MFMKRELILKGTESYYEATGIPLSKDQAFYEWVFDEKFAQWCTDAFGNVLVIPAEGLLAMES